MAAIDSQVPGGRARTRGPPKRFPFHHRCALWRIAPSSLHRILAAKRRVPRAQIRHSRWRPNFRTSSSTFEIGPYTLTTERTFHCRYSALLWHVPSANKGPNVSEVPVRLVNLPPHCFVERRVGFVPGTAGGRFTWYDNGNLQKVTLDTASNAVSVALAIQVNPDVRGVPTIIRKREAWWEAATGWQIPVKRP